MEQVFMSEVPVGEVFIYEERTFMGGGCHFNGVGGVSIVRERLCVRVDAETYSVENNNDSTLYCINPYQKVWI